MGRAQSPGWRSGGCHLVNRPSPEESAHSSREKSRTGISTTAPPQERTVAERRQMSTHDSGGGRGSAGPGRPKPALLSSPVAEHPPCGGLGFFQRGGLGQSDHPLAELLEATLQGLGGLGSEVPPHRLFHTESWELSESHPEAAWVWLCAGELAQPSSNSPADRGLLSPQGNRPSLGGPGPPRLSGDITGFHTIHLGRDVTVRPRSQHIGPF